MQLPDAKMQISFWKDLATPRNPRSRFTFISYLYHKNRLNQFINLGTFLPSRLEYEDYLRWCASYFEEQDMVSYGQEVLEVVPDVLSPDGKVTQFRVISRDSRRLEITTRLAKRVVIAVGGLAMLPKEFPSEHLGVIHSSKYLTKVGESLNDPKKPYNIAVIGSGQSAAEIFNDLPSRYPNARVIMIIKGSTLRPSDDSPFVNEIFDPDRVDGLYQQSESGRARRIALDRATNYSVVRLDLLEHLYQKLYDQRLHSSTPNDWKIQIKTNKRVVKVQEIPERKLVLQLQNVVNDEEDSGPTEQLTFDAVFVATGYVRDAHEGILRKTRALLRHRQRDGTGKLPVRRDYKIDFDEEKVSDDAGIWLQGCNESTHGVSKIA
jgi:L-ornithine N5-oxygenase